MKRILTAVFLLFACLISCTACGNKSFIDTTYTFERALIYLPNGECLDVNVKSWTDYEDGDQIQITTDDGITYLVHSENCVLVHEVTSTTETE